MSKKIFLFIVAFLLLIFIFLNKDFQSNYERPIQGDAIGYYSYLPAIFIYKDLNYNFIGSNMDKYYPPAYNKQFRNKQKNGKYVNKCFPGLSILYFPFFIFSIIYAWIFQYPMDGFSFPFQIGIVLAHLFYYLVGLSLLYNYLKKFTKRNFYIQLCLIGITFGTNCWYNLIYDHSVSHIFNFFLISLLLFYFGKLASSRQSKFLGYILVCLSLLVICRPTNIFVLLFLPLLMEIHEISIKQLFNFFSPIRDYFLFILLAVVLLFIPLVLWKVQSDLWIVYSYNNETFDFSKPQFWDYIFSYKKGWLLWSPLLFLYIVFSLVYFYFKKKLLILFFLAPILLLIYIFSSWWIWTFGMGMGQRPMIDFYPFLGIGMVCFLDKYRIKLKSIIVVLLPFIYLNCLQAYQISNSILIGGSSTKSSYWNHFGQWKTSAPLAKISSKWKKIDQKIIPYYQFLKEQKAFSKAIKFEEIPSVDIVFVSLKIGGEHKDKNLNLVVTNKDVSYYQTVFLGPYIYSKPRVMSFIFSVSNIKNKEFSCYVWNGDTKSEAIIERFKVILFEK